MRDVSNYQRRRRLLLLQSDAGAFSDRAAQDGWSEDNSTVSLLDFQSAADAENMARMVEDCHVPSETELLIEGPRGKTTTISLDQPFALVGRHPACDVRIDHPEVAPCHAYLQWWEGALFWTELAGSVESTNNGSTAPTGCWVNGNSLQLASHRISLSKHVAAKTPAFNPFDHSPTLADEFPQLLLKFDGVHESDNRWEVDRPLTLIGSGGACKLRLNHPAMPPVLASLVRTQTGCWLINLTRRNAVQVNGQPITFAPLDLGDVIQLGPFQARVTVDRFRRPSIPFLKTPRVRIDVPVETIRPTGDEVSQATDQLQLEQQELLQQLNASLTALQEQIEVVSADITPERRAKLAEYLLRASRLHQEWNTLMESLRRDPSLRD